MTICTAGVEYFHADRRIDTKKLIVASQLCKCAQKLITMVTPQWM